MTRRTTARRNKLSHAHAFLPDPLESRVLFSQINIPVTNTNDMGSGSLRHAIVMANAVSPGNLANIQFKIPGTGVHTINLKSRLPFITAQVDIVGQTDSKGNPLTELNGQNAGLFSDGLFLDPNNTSGPASEITGLIINRFGSAGIDVHGGKAIIFGCRIGTNAAGTAALPNKQEGILLEGHDSTIGETGAGPAFQMLISGNNGDGIRDVNNQNIIQNCLIGTDVTGTKAIPNGGWGIEDSGNGNSNGHAGAHSGLVVSGNKLGGIHFTGTECEIANSKIGTDITGNKALPNKGEGIEFDGASNCSAGDLVKGGSNVISANAEAGVASFNSPNCQMLNNFIGTNAAGTAKLGNVDAGVFIDSISNTVLSNLISGNGFDGVVIEEDSFMAKNNSVQLNRIGTDITGKKPIPNKGDGVLINVATSNFVAFNVIAFNTIQGDDGFGVDVLGHAAFGNKITRNDIFSNGRLGINIGDNDGKPLPNDKGDGDTGPNRLQNDPVLTSAKKISNGIQVKGTLNSKPHTSFTIEFFASTVADPSGFGEGEQIDGQATVTTDASGNATFTVTLDAVANKLIWTATATNNSTGDTSEFSKAIKQT